MSERSPVVATVWPDLFLIFPGGRNTACSLGGMRCIKSLVADKTFVKRVLTLLTLEGIVI